MAKASARTVPLSALLAEVAEKHRLPKQAVGPIVDDFVDLTVKNLRKGYKVRITGLGTMQVQKRPARMARNPATGEPIRIRVSRNVVDSTDDDARGVRREPKPASGQAQHRSADASILAEARRRAASIKRAGVKHRSLAKLLATRKAREGYAAGEAAQWAADLIREMRRRRGISQAELARNMKVEASRIGELERGVGRYGPSLRKLKEVADACGFKLVVGFE